MAKRAKSGQAKSAVDRFNSKAPVWKGQNMLERIDMCRSLLHILGYLSDAEDSKVKQRIDKAVDAAMKESGMDGPRPERVPACS